MVKESKEWQSIAERAIAECELWKLCAERRMFMLQASNASDAAGFRKATSQGTIPLEVDQTINWMEIARTEAKAKQDLEQIITASNARKLALLGELEALRSLQNEERARWETARAHWTNDLCEAAKKIRELTVELSHSRSQTDNLRAELADSYNDNGI